MAKKKLAAVVKIQIQAGGATPAPPVGTALGPHGINIMDFCKAYNAATENQRGQIIPVDISIYEDRTFTFVTKTPPTPFLLRQAAGIEKGSSLTPREKAGKVTKDQVRAIAEQKMPDLNAIDLDGCDGPGRGHGPIDGPRRRLRTADRTTPPVDDLATGARGRPRELERSAHMTKHGKKYTDAGKRFDREQLHDPVEALDLVKTLAPAKFDETIEAAFRLGVDPRKADQMLRGTVSLPKGTGKSVRVAVFAQGDAARAAEEAGADIVGAEDLVARVEGGFMDFDVAIATPDLMGQVGKLGRSLGPRGLMPNPKTGTVTPDVAKAVTEFKAGKVEYRTDRYGNVHVPLGKVSFDRDALTENYTAVLDELLRAKPASAKGRYLRSVSLSSTMGPGVKVDPARAKLEELIPGGTE